MNRHHTSPAVAAAPSPFKGEGRGEGKDARSPNAPTLTPALSLEGRGWAESALVVLAALTATLLCGAAGAGTVDYDLAKFNPDEWEIEGAEYVRVENDGLHVRIPAGKRVTVRLKRYFRDEFDMNVRFQRVELQPGNHFRVGFFLENPELKAWDETNYNTEWWQDRRLGQAVAGCRVNQFIRKGDKELLRGGGFDHGEITGFRFYKTDTHVWPLHFGDRWEWTPRKYWLLGMYDNFRPREEDIDSFRPGFYLESYYDKNKEIEVVFKSLTVWGFFVRAPGEPPADPKVFRFDFGPVAQQLAEDYLPVTNRVRYTKERGWGWVNPREPIDNVYHLPQMSNEEAVKVGMPPTPNTHYWLGYNERLINWVEYHKKSFISSFSHGGDYVEFFQRYLDLKTPVERDLVGTNRPYGFPYDQRIEADQWERRGAIYVDDDLSTEFAVDVPNDRYTLLIGVGYNLFLPGGASPFALDAEGRHVKQLSGYWARCTCFRVDDVEVKDGQLNLRFYANRRLAMNIVEAWAVGVSWHINYLVIVPSDRKEEIEAEEWRIIKDRGLKVRQVTFVEGWPAEMTIRDGHVVAGGKPFIPMLWQAFHPPDSQRHYPYYLWGNTDAITGVSAEFTGSQHFMKTEWFKLSAADHYPWRAIDALNVNHLDGKLALIRVDGLLNFVPAPIAGEGGTLQDARGRTDRWNVRPPLNSRLGREVQREAYHMVNYQLKLHPTLGGHYIYEELWHPEGQGYDWQSVHQYHEYLTQKYETVEKLNAEWGTDFKDISEIKPPPQSEESANWANFRAFRMWAQCQDVKHPCDMLKELQPEHTTFGAKGDYPTASWYHAEQVGIFGWYSSTIPRVAADYFAKAPSVGGIPGDCYWAYVDGRKQRDHYPGPKRYTGRTRHHAYVDLFRAAFDGTKSFRFEEYDDDISHYFHRSKQMKEREGITRRWTGELAWFDPEAFTYAEVTPDEGPLQQTCWAALLYRLAPLLCPAKVLKPRVAIMVTDESFFLEGKFVFPTEPVHDVLWKLQVPFDVIRKPMFDRLDRYQVVILGTFTEMIRLQDAERLKEYIRKGGKLILIAPAVMRSAIDLKQPAVCPGFGLDQVAGCTIRDLGRRPVTPQGNLMAALPGETSLSADLGQVGQVRYLLDPGEKAKVLAKADDYVLALTNADASVVTLALAPGDSDHRLRQDPVGGWTVSLVGRLFDAWGVNPGFGLEGAKKPAELTAGVLEGDGYWLVGLTNRDAQESQFTCRLNFLPEGRYEVVDVTGERPDILIDERRGLHLARDPKYRRVEHVASDVTAQELKTTGLKLQIAARQGLTLLVRPAGENVWVVARDYTLKVLCSQPVTVVMPDQPDPRVGQLAQRIFDFLKSRKVPVELKRASDVELKKTAHEVWVRSQFEGVPKDYKGYLCDTFNNEVVVTDTHLIVIGSEETNSLTRHLGLHDSYVYDKVLFDVDAKFPGPGRGVVQTVDTVNLPYYDATDRTRDAILIGGSDPAGTVLAGEAFLKAVADLSEYRPRVKEKQLDVLEETDEERRLRLKTQPKVAPDT